MVESREYRWFKSRFEIFTKMGDNCIDELTGNTDDVTKLMFSARKPLQKSFNNTKLDKYDSLGFFIDSIIEDLESITILAKAGFSSSMSSLLRRILISLGKIVYIRKNPSDSINRKSGKIKTDRELMNLLETVDINKDSSLYSSLCKATHLNMDWIEVAQYAKIVNRPDKTNYLLVESILLTAQKFSIQAVMVIKDIVNTENVESFDKTEELLSECVATFLYNEKTFVSSVDDL